MCTKKVGVPLLSPPSFLIFLLLRRILFLVVHHLLSRGFSFFFPWLLFCFCSSFIFLLQWCINGEKRKRGRGKERERRIIWSVCTLGSIGGATFCCVCLSCSFSFFFYFVFFLFAHVFHSPHACMHAYGKRERRDIYTYRCISVFSHKHSHVSVWWGYWDRCKQGRALQRGRCSRVHKSVDTYLHKAYIHPYLFLCVFRVEEEGGRGGFICFIPVYIHLFLSCPCCYLYTWTPM